ncbi:uncharacterized protein LOC105355423 isoform X2 [Oryzias latipes]|uniref:uncharacterized protein LOC105355423 isoform X2 n=1 Tax=Oryzias latipes TaxID=8090 RepID=UPI000CE24369|nr:uncharacterized protein LOC105355423 isoform X2 [Oryzias latipes]
MRAKMIRDRWMLWRVCCFLIFCDLILEAHAPGNKAKTQMEKHNNDPANTFDPNSQRWCGPEIDKNILEKKFKNHLCCGHKQFNSQTQSCSDNLQVENLTNNDNKNTERTAEIGKCGSGVYNKTTELCCGPTSNKTILKKMSEDHLCCGRNQYHKRTQRCSEDLQVQNITGSNSETEPCGVYNKTTELCCGPTSNKTILKKMSEDHLCCGRNQYHKRTQRCSEDLQVQNITGSNSETEPCGVYNKTTELCCGPTSNKTILKKMSEDHLCCGRNQYHKRTQRCSEDLQVQNITGSNSETEPCGVYNKTTELCCGPTSNKTILKKMSEDHLCCGRNQYHKRTQRCSEDLQVQNITGSNSETEPCGVYNKTTELCCGPTSNKTILKKMSEDHLCCGRNQYHKRTQRCSEDLQVQNITGSNSETEPCGVYNKTTELCCGPTSNKTILKKMSEDHLCCGRNQYHKRTQRCSEDLQVQNITGSNSETEPCGVYNKTTELCCGPTSNKTILKKMSEDHLCCGRNQYHKRTQRCSEDLQVQNITGSNSETEPCGVYNKTTELCCGPTSNKTILKKMSEDHLCCGRNQYHKRTQRCSEDLQVQNITGSNSETEPCGGSLKNHLRRCPKEGFHCCGKKAFNISDPLKKCCGGTLYNLTNEQSSNTQCCGSLLQNQKEVCCSSEYKAVVYSAGDDFKCCGHHYYNTSLWSCCRGRLCLGQHADSAESTLLSINNLNKAQLCKQIFFGTVQSVFKNRTVFSNVLEIHGEKATVRHHVEPYIMKTEKMCSILKLTLGKWYFLNNTHVFTDFNHKLLQQSLYFILSKCSQ